MTLVDDESMAPLLDVVGLPIQAQGLTLSTLKLLVTLDISRNMLTVLPVDFLLLTLLEKLNVKENQVLSLLLSLLDLLVQSTNTDAVKENQLSQLYLEFCMMPKLKEILRENNVWRSPHECIVALPTRCQYLYVCACFTSTKVQILTPGALLSARCLSTCGWCWRRIPRFLSHSTAAACRCSFYLLLLVQKHKYLQLRSSCRP
jgi:hypothetical protein